MKDYAIDPAAGDHVFVSGAPQMTADLMNNIYLSLATVRGTQLTDREFGSRLHLLRREKAVPRVAAQAKLYCDEALAWIVRSGRATSISVGAELDAPNNRVLCAVQAVQNGKTVEYTHFVRIG